MSGSVSQPVLVLDTTNHWCACALDAGAQVIERAEDLGRGHAERLAPMVKEVLTEAQLAPTALARIGVNIGPGSFAGTRVGVAFARGLALASQAQPIGIGLLPALAQTLDPDHHSTVMAVHDAKRGELVWQIFERGSAQGPAQTARIEQVKSAFSAHGNPRLIGSGASLIDPDSPDFEARPPLKALLSLTRAAPGNSPLPAPLYARAPDAKLPGGVDPAATA